MDRWSQLSMSEKSDLMSLYIRNGINSLEEIKKHYNSFATGGNLHQDDDPKIENNPYINKRDWALNINNPDYLTDNYTTKELDTLKKRFYANYFPWGYHINAAVDAFNNPNTDLEKLNIYSHPTFTSYTPTTESAHIRDEFLATYLGIPRNERRKISTNVLQRGDYRPKGSEGKNYYKINHPELAETLVGLYNDMILNKSGRVNPFTGNINNKVTEKGNIQIGPNKLDNIFKLQDFYFEKPLKAGLEQLGAFTIGKGVDPEKGEYISYYDMWDVNPFHGQSSKYPVIGLFTKDKDVLKGLGNPFGIYDRVYLDDYYGMSSKPTEPNAYYGGWLPEIDITAEKR